MKHSTFKPLKVLTIVARVSVITVAGISFSTVMASCIGGSPAPVSTAPSATSTQEHPDHPTSKDHPEHPEHPSNGDHPDHPSNSDHPEHPSNGDHPDHPGS